VKHATDICILRKAAEVENVTSGLSRLFLAALQVLRLWRERSRQRRRLAELDDRMLRDIGFDRVAALEEASKPFWLCSNGSFLWVDLARHHDATWRGRR